MSVLVDENTRLFVQAITGAEGSFHTKQMIDYGTQVVGGATPGKGGQEFEGVPVFNTVAEGVAATSANASVIFVPPPFAADAIMEAADAGLEPLGQAGQVWLPHASQQVAQSGHVGIAWSGRGKRQDRDKILLREHRARLGSGLRRHRRAAGYWRHGPGPG